MVRVLVSVWVEVMVVVATVLVVSTMAGSMWISAHQ
jgi:hypothetical protein